MSDPGSVVVLLCTAPVDGASALVDALLQERLIACANFVEPVRSRYLWQGKIEAGDETLLVMKTCREQLDRLRARVDELHPYDVPELLEVPVIGGLESYLQWVRDSTGPAADAP